MIDKWKKAVDNHKVFGAVLLIYQKHFSAFVMICSLQN